MAVTKKKNKHHPKMENYKTIKLQKCKNTKNGRCNDLCDTYGCQRDGGDCVKECDETVCPYTILGDGICDQACNNSACNYGLSFCVYVCTCMCVCVCVCAFCFEIGVVSSVFVVAKRKYRQKTQKTQKPTKNAIKKK